MMKVLGKNFYLSNMHFTSRTLKASAILGMGLGLLACSDSEVAGGGPSGSEAGNAITAQILTSNNAPAVLARARLTPCQSLDTIGSYTAETDSDGQVSFQNVANGDYILEVKQGGDAMQANIYVSDSSMSLGAKNLAKMASVSGALETSNDGIIKIRGLNHSAPVVGGEFVLDSLPEGHLDLVFIPDESTDTVSTYVNAASGSNTAKNTFASERNSLLLDDFEDGDNQHRFGPMYFGPSDGGWWYLVSEKNVLISTGLDSDNFLELADVDGNKMFHTVIDFEALDSLSYDENGKRVLWPWANMGVELGSNDKSICYDLTSVSTVTFKAKGTGNLNFRLVDEVHKTDDFDGEFAVFNFTLTDDWNTITIPLDEIVDANKGSLSCVTLLSWAATNSIDFWLDDVELVGGNKASIWEK